ncbi:uncharacterized protein EMH_0074010 [Eimeria mitis]|uniref:Uncharacterized protein n=1 Tax=Eimeria mitis TaxID=44415 RepID=U6KC15_9EIME|nr:uncharacterized protein EMH_0074010 [Eimeria mitis]CDJ35479.1 hypothetical protein EMH_0074010 [Eimeria mitis]
MLFLALRCRGALPSKYGIRRKFICLARVWSRLRCRFSDGRHGCAGASMERSGDVVWKGVGARFALVALLVDIYWGVVFQRCETFVRRRAPSEATSRGWRRSIGAARNALRWANPAPPAEGSVRTIWENDWGYASLQGACATATAVTSGLTELVTHDRRSEKCSRGEGHDHVGPTLSRLDCQSEIP